MRRSLTGSDPRAVRRSLIVAAAAVMALLGPLASAAPAQELDATLAARQKALGKGKRAYQETILTAPEGGAASEKELKLAAKVAVFQEAPRERLEIRAVSGRSFAEPVVLVSNGAGYFLVTKVGSTPLKGSARASDSVVLQALTSMPGESAGRREVKGAGGELLAVVYRESRTADFNSSTAFSMKAAKIGDNLLKKSLASFGESDDTAVTASAGARGVDEIQTPGGTVSVTPDSSAVVWLESLEVGPLELEAFLLAGGLGPYAASPTEEAR